MKRLLATLIAVSASALLAWRLMRRVQHLQAELARSHRELASQRARALEVERQLASLNTPAAAPAFSRGVVANNGFVSVDALKAEAEAAAADLQATADVAASAEDDLTQIDGIGPVFAGRLRQRGIVTFSRLAETSPAALAEIIEAPAWRQPNFTAWINEAADRAAGKTIVRSSRAALTP